MERDFSVFIFQPLKRIILSLMLMIVAVWNAMGTDIYYQLVTSADQLEAGCNYIIGSDCSGNYAKFMSTDKNASNRPQTSGYAITNDYQVKYDPSMLQLTLGGSTGEWTILTRNYKGTNGYLNATSYTDMSRLVVEPELDNYSKFSISFDSERKSTIIKCTGKQSYHIMRYQSTYSYFSCFNPNNQADIFLYKEIVQKESVTLVAQSGTSYYATFSNSDAVEFTDETTKVYTVALDPQDDNKIFLTEVTSKQVPANSGVLIKAAGTSAAFRYIQSAATLENNLLKPGTGAETEGTNCLFYKLAYDDYDAKTGLGFYWGADNGGPFIAKAGGAYLAVPNSAGTARGFSFDDCSEGIDLITDDSAQRSIFTLSGQKVNELQKGLNIVNGKKVLVK